MFGYVLVTCHRVGGIDDQLGDRLVIASGFRLGLLPQHLFPSGHVYFIQRLARRVGNLPYAIHLTFQNCDAVRRSTSKSEDGQIPHEIMKDVTKR